MPYPSPKDSLEKAKVYGQKTGKWFLGTRNGERGLIAKRHEGTSGDDENVLYFDYDSIYTFIHSCINLYIPVVGEDS